MNTDLIIKLLKEEDLYLEDTIGNNPLEFSYLSFSSLDIAKNTLFVCKGNNFKEEYLLDAIKKGAICYLAQASYISSKANIPYILVKDITKAMALVAKKFYEFSRLLTLIGVTGTKGKTTTINFIHDILSTACNTNIPYISTIDYYTGKSRGTSHNTTPESLYIYRFLKEASESNKDYFVMEVSSQAYKMQRIYGLNFDYGIFLNIAPDHISSLEHKDFKEYLNAKLGFLKQCKTVLLYALTDHFDYLYNELIKSGVKVYTFGSERSDFKLINIKSEEDGSSFDLVYQNKTYSFKINIEGDFNCLNAMAACSLALLLNIPYEDIKKAILNTFVSGRMNVYKNFICPVVVDYAHNKLSAEALFKTLKKDYPNRNLKVVFGCPGDKAFNRREELATLSGLYASYVYITMEDPQSKNVYDICEDIVSYLKPYNKPYEVIIDRKKAIIKALENAQEDDIIAIIGKGDEDYQLINNQYVPYESDVKVVEKYLEEKVGSL